MQFKMKKTTLIALATTIAILAGIGLATVISTVAHQLAG